MPNPDKKYPTYEALAEAFRTGGLDPEKYVLLLDNDNCHLAVRVPVDAEDELDVCYEWFEGYGYGDLKAAVTACGIPCEDV